MNNRILIDNIKKYFKTKILNIELQNLNNTIAFYCMNSIPEKAQSIIQTIFKG